MFAARRKRLLEALGPDSVAIVLGAHLATRSNDTEYRFRQDSDFWYLTGFAEPEACLVLLPDLEGDGPGALQPGCSLGALPRAGREER